MTLDKSVTGFFFFALFLRVKVSTHWVEVKQLEPCLAWVKHDINVDCSYYFKLGRTIQADLFLVAHLSLEWRGPWEETCGE
jgi:hypothetical protein